MTNHITCPSCNQPSYYNFSGRDIMFNNYVRYDYYCCGTCQLIFQYPTPQAGDIANFYPDSYMVYNSQTTQKKISNLRKSKLKQFFGYHHLSTPALANLASRLIYRFKRDFEIKYVSSGKILDVGCGNGRFLDGMKKLGWNAYGVEFNESAANLCKKSGLNVHHGDIFSARFDNDFFDVINVSHVVEHVPDAKHFISELNRVLKKDGALIIKTPNNEALGRTYLGTHWYHNDVPRHLYLFSLKSLETLATLCGFKLLQSHTRSSPKALLRSIDYANKSVSSDSSKSKWKRSFAHIYVFISERKNRGDEIFAVFKKR